MARQDWGALQKQFLAEHARTGISPEEWCKEQGLKYSTAKRHIKIGTRVANSQKKTANKKANGEVRKTEQKPTVSDSLSDFKVTFTIEWADTRWPRVANVKIYNLSADTNNRIMANEFSKVRIIAG